MKYNRHLIVTNDFIPRLPTSKEYMEITLYLSCINCHKKYDDKEIIFTTLSDGRIKFWHRFHCNQYGQKK